MRNTRSLLIVKLNVVSVIYWIARNDTPGSVEDTFQTVVVNSSIVDSPGQRFRQMVNSLCSTDKEKEKEVDSFLITTCWSKYKRVNIVINLEAKFVDRYPVNCMSTVLNWPKPMDRNQNTLLHRVILSPNFSKHSIWPCYYFNTGMNNK